MASPNALAIAEAEQLLADLKSNSDSPVTHARTLQRLDQLRCLLQSGLDSLLFHARGVSTVYCICNTLLTSGTQFQILPTLNVLIEHGVFDAVPLQSSITIDNLATAVKLDAATLGTAPFQ